MHKTEDQLIKTIHKSNEKVQIFKHGEDDFSIYYEEADYSLRGTLEEVKEDYKEYFGEEMEF